MMEKVGDKIEKQRRFWNRPSNGLRLVTFSWSMVENINLQNIMNDTSLSLRFSLEKWNKRNGFEDDSIPMLRPEIGTGLVASAFGAELLFKKDNLPAVKTYPVQSMDDLRKLNFPSYLTEGCFPQIYEVIEYFKQNMPEYFKLCHCDLQGPWNTAQLLTGEKLFLDIYDDPVRFQNSAEL